MIVDLNIKWYTFIGSYSYQDLDYNKSKIKTQKYTTIVESKIVSEPKTLDSTIKLSKSNLKMPNLGFNDNLKHFKSSQLKVHTWMASNIGVQLGNLIPLFEILSFSSS